MRATPRKPLHFQNGGFVPGKGQGDKIPAKYEPGEFVVSNDMLDDNPGLRQQLSSLRDESLFGRGIDPAQADAKARSGGALRAADGLDPSRPTIDEARYQQQTGRPAPGTTAPQKPGVVQRLGNGLKAAPGWAARAATAASANVGVAQSFRDLGTGYRDEFDQSIGAEGAGPLATAGADTLRTMTNVGNVLTGGYAENLGRGISNYISGTGGFMEGFSQPTSRDAFEAARENPAQAAATQAATALPPSTDGARPDLGYGPIADRTQLTNEQAAVRNSAGVVKVTKGANGNPEFSGMDLRGQVSYANADGKALPGGGWDGKGFSSFAVAPAGSNVVLGPNGSGTRSAEQLQQDIANSKQQVAAQAQRLGVDVAGLSPAQALKYMGEVENARSINAAGAAAAAEYDRSGKWLNDLRDPRTLALRNASTGQTIFRNRREHDAAMRERQKNYENTWNLVAGAPDREANRELEYTKSANTLRGQEMQANASMYGSDTTLRGNMYQSDLTAATAAQKAEADRRSAAYTQAKDYTAAQRTAREEAVNMFRREGDKDAGAAEQRVNVADQILPGFSTMDTASKARARPTVDSAVDLFDRMKAQTPQGMWEKLTSSDKPGLTGLPLIQGWKVERSFGGDHYITNPKTKQTITIGSGLNDMQLKMLENATQTGSFLPQNK